MRKDRAVEDEKQLPKLAQGEDYYFENGLMVLTAKYLKERGYCCENGCRHCPYPNEKVSGLKEVDL